MKNIYWQYSENQIKLLNCSNLSMDNLAPHYYFVDGVCYEQGTENYVYPAKFSPKKEDTYIETLNMII